jgi:hypothetical protein
MSTRFSLLALAAVATIGAAALAPTSASANLPMGVIVKPHPILGVVVHPPHPILGVVVHPPHPILGVVVHPPHPILGIVVHPPHPILGVVVHPPMDPDPPRVWWHHHRAPWLVEDGDTARVSTPVATVPTGPCNCLTKKYLEDGSVLFKDVCTKEAAMATPDELRAQMQGVGPEPH